MAKKFFSEKSLVSLFVAAMMILVSNVFVSCDQERIEEAPAKQTTSVVKKDNPEPPTEPGENWWLKRDSINNGHEYSFDILAGDSTSSVTAVSRGFADITENDKYTIEERYRNLDLAYANAHKVLGKPECSMSNGNMNVVTLATFGLEDGNVVKVNSNISHAIAKVNGINRFFPCDSLTDVRLISVNNVERAATTRAAAEYISDSVYTEIKAELTYVTTGLTQNYTYTQILGDTITRYILSKNEIDSIWYENVYRKVLNASSEECGFEKVILFKNGEKQVLAKKIILQYGVENIAEYEKQVSDFGYAFVSTNGVSKGESKMNRTEEHWTVNRRVDTYSSNFTNAAKQGIQTSYTLFHESTVYDDGDIKVEFPMIDMTVAEGSTKVTNIASTKGDWYEMARLDNGINVDYQGYGLTSAEDVILYKEALHIISEGWDSSSAKKTITLWNVHTVIDYVVTYSDGTEERDTYEGNFGWAFEPVSNWDVTAENNTYYTSAVNAAISGADKSKKTQDGKASYAWVENTHTLTASVTVANGTQEDKWMGKTVNDITITRNGNVYSFGHDDYSLNDGGAKLGDATTTDTETVYPYTHSVNFGFGGVKTGEVSVPGKIHVAKPAIPTFFDKKVLGMTAIVANNPEHTDYLYTMLAHLEGGYVVPGVWNKNGELVWHLEWTVKTDATNLNGAAYEHSSGRWVPVRGYDAPDCLQYDTESGANADNQSYATALKWNWDEGHKVNGHASVTTKRISFSIVDGVATATDTYTNASLGSWTYAK